MNSNKTVNITFPVVKKKNTNSKKEFLSKVIDTFLFYFDKFKDKDLIIISNYEDDDSLYCEYYFIDKKINETIFVIRFLRLYIYRLLNLKAVDNFVDRFSEIDSYKYQI